MKDYLLKKADNAEFFSNPGLNDEAFLFNDKKLASTNGTPYGMTYGKRIATKLKWNEKAANDRLYERETLRKQALLAERPDAEIVFTEALPAPKELKRNIAHAFKQNLVTATDIKGIISDTDKAINAQSTHRNYLLGNTEDKIRQLVNASRNSSLPQTSRDGSNDPFSLKKELKVSLMNTGVEKKTLEVKKNSPISNGLFCHWIKNEIKLLQQAVIFSRKRIRRSSLHP